MALANRVVSVAAQGVVIVGPAIGALAILGSMHLNPALMVVGLSVIGLVAASRLGDDPPKASVSARSGTMLQAITLWRGDALLRRTTVLTSGYNFVDAALWFSFYYVAKVQLQLADTSLAMAMLPGVVGCLAGYWLSRPFSTSPRLGFLAAYLLLGVALLPMVMLSRSVLGIALTVFVLSASSFIAQRSRTIVRPSVRISWRGG
ncbi:hypothetical protein LJR296_007254 [Cupriavidus necator]|uniref:hypothetical protein n=1 Tax=Cupriavidus necator TaxID=106590 RepID=UPI003ECF496D